MQTSSSSLLSNRPVAQVALAIIGTCAILAITLTGPQPASPNALFGTMAAQPAISCREATGPLAEGLNSAVHWALGEVTTHPRVSKLPIDAKIRVGLYTTQIDNITLDELAVEEIDMDECKRPRDIFKSIPRILPDVIELSIKGIEVGVGLNYDSNGLCGLWCVGGVAGEAKSRVTGTLNMTISYEKADLTEVTACDGDFEVQKTEILGKRAGDADLPTLSGLPLGKILCYGTKRTGGLLMGVEVTNTKTGKELDSSKPFPGLVALLNSKFAAVMPGLRHMAEEMHEAEVNVAERIG